MNTFCHQLPHGATISSSHVNLPQQKQQEKHKRITYFQHAIERYDKQCNPIWKLVLLVRNRTQPVQTFQLRDNNLFKICQCYCCNHRPIPHGEEHSQWSQTITVPVAFNLSNVNGFLDCSDKGKDNEIKKQKLKKYRKKIKIRQGERGKWKPQS